MRAHTRLCRPYWAVAVDAGLWNDFAAANAPHPLQRSRPTICENQAGARASPRVRFRSVWPGRVRLPTL
jgi:hypothetical protein